MGVWFTYILIFMFLWQMGNMGPPQPIGNSFPLPTSRYAHETSVKYSVDLFFGNLVWIELTYYSYVPAKMTRFPFLVCPDTFLFLECFSLQLIHLPLFLSPIKIFISLLSPFNTYTNHFSLQLNLITNNS